MRSADTREALVAAEFVADGIDDVRPRGQRGSGNHLAVFHDPGHLPMYHCGARVLNTHRSLIAQDGLAAPEEGSRPTAVIAIVRQHLGDYLYTPPDATHAAAADGGCVYFVTLPKPVVMLKNA